MGSVSCERRKWWSWRRRNIYLFPRPLIYYTYILQQNFKAIYNLRKVQTHQNYCHGTSRPYYTTTTIPPQRKKENEVAVFFSIFFCNKLADRILAIEINEISFDFFQKMTQHRSGMEDENSIFPDEHMLFSDNLHPDNWDCLDCPPPEFHLPPPPRPPWMDELDDCDDQTRLADLLQHSSTCDSNLQLISVNDTQSYFEDTFHSIAVIVVCSVILVILLLAIGVFIFKWVLLIMPVSLSFSLWTSK